MIPCTRPPAGWLCTRDGGHDGPCAAWPVRKFGRLTYAGLCVILRQVHFPDYQFHALLAGVHFTIFATYLEKDTVTGELETQATRQWFILNDSTEQQVVFTCFKLVLTSMEHRTREWFLYKNKPILQPHHSLDKLLEITEERPTPVESK